MLTYTCTQCGGRVEEREGSRIGKCPACGSLFVLPNGFPQKQNLYKMALEARLAGNFRAAERDYAKILKIDAGETEAHWGYLLSKFGITVTGDQQIFFSRLENTSFTGDPGYGKMIECCPEEALYYYQGLSLRIEEKHRRLLEVAAAAGRYDVFIDCTASQGTADYILANRAGKALDDAGYRVFLPAAMLSGVPEEERNLYEIAIAENSKAMLIPATPRTDYGNRRFGISWRYFLELRRNDAGRRLLSIYQDIRPDKELPLELQSFQAFDCGGSSFEEGLVAEINRMFGRRNRTLKVTREVLEKLNRAEEACERGVFGEAETLFEEVIALDAEESAAHWGLVLCMTKNLKEPASDEELDIHFSNAVKFAPDPETARTYRLRMAELMSDAVWEELMKVTSDFSDRSAYGRAESVIERVYLYFPKEDARLTKIAAYRNACRLAGELKELQDAYKRSDTAADPLFAEEQKAADRYTAARTAVSFFMKNRRMFYLLIFGSVLLILAANLLLMRHFDYERTYKGLQARLAFLLSDAGLVFLSVWSGSILTGRKKDGKVSWKASLLIAAALIAISKIGVRSRARETLLIALLIPAVLFVIQRVYVSRQLSIRRSESGQEEKELVRLRRIREQIRESYEKKAEALRERYGMEAFLIPEFIPDSRSDASRILGEERRKERMSSGLLYAVNTVLMLVAFVYGITFAFNQAYASKWKNITQLAVESYHLVGLREDGSVVAAGYNNHGQRNVSGWKDIVQIAAGEEFTAGLTAEGTVRIAAEEDSVYMEAEGWTDIVAISAARRHLVGLKKDGTCVAAGPDETGECEVEDFRDIVEIHAADGPEGQFTYGLGSDGRVYCTPYEHGGLILAEEFEKRTGPEEGQMRIRRIYGDYWAIVAIDDTGKISAYGSDYYGQLSAALAWDGNELTDIYAANFTVGLKKDGTCVSGGNLPNVTAAVRSFRNVTALTGSDAHVLALQGDGKVLAAGENGNGQCNVQDWENITSVTAGRYNSFGIREDGGVEAAGYNTCGLTYTRPKNPVELIWYFAEYITEW